MKNTANRLLRRLAPKQYSARYEKSLERRNVWVDPQTIEFVTPRHPALDHFSPRIVDGDWDTLTERFEDRLLFRAFEEVFLGGRAWGDTVWYQEVLNRIAAGQALWECRSERDFRARLERIEAMYATMRDVGYCAANNVHEVSVNIGRNGDLLFNDGEHRLAMARLLRLPSIPVRIVARHLQWIRFKNQILDFARTHRGEVYAPLLHPDLERIQSSFSHLRFELIRQAMQSTGGRLLDIGCNWGYMCARFQRLGFQCTGVEENAWVFHFLSRLRRAYHGSYEIVHRSVFDYVTPALPPFDVVFALAIFHHFIKTRETHERFRTLVRTLQVKEMFFLPHREDEAQMDGAFWRPTERDFVDFILEHSPTLKKAEPVGFADDGRRLFRISAN